MTPRFASTIAFALLLTTIATATPRTNVIRIRAKSFHTLDDSPTTTFLRIKISRYQGQNKTLADVLKQVPGLLVRRSGGAIQRTSISIRGSDSHQTLILIDGIPLNNAQGGGVDLSQIPLTSIKRIDVLRGGLSALYGSSAIGGVINLITRTGRRKPRTDLALGLGSFGTYHAALTRAGSRGAIRFSAGLSYRQSTGNFLYIDDAGLGRRRQNNDGKHSSVFANIASRRGKLSWAMFSRLAYVKRGIAGLDQFPTLFARQSSLLWVLGARVMAAGLFNKWTVDNRFTVRLNRQTFGDPKPTIGGVIDNRNLNARIGLEHRSILSLAAAHELRFSVATNIDLGRYRRLDATTARPSRINFGLLANYRFRPFGGRFLIAPALRLDVTQGFGATIVPHLGLRYAPVGWFSLTANVARSYRTPSFDELFFDIGSVRGNANLRAEDALSADFGIQLGNSALSLEATFFYLEISNLILFLPKTAYLVEADDSQAARTLGLEIALRARPFSWLSISCAYTLLDARFKNRQRFGLPLRPRHRLHVTAKLLFRYVTIYLDFDAQSRFSVDRFESNFEGSRLFINAGLQLRPHRKLRVSIDARNLLNIKDATDSLQSPLPGLAVSASLSVFF